MAIKQGISTIVFLIPYFGKALPAWFDIFLATCRFQKGIDWIFFTDCPVQDEFNRDNVKFVRMTINEFQILAEKEMGYTFPICLSNRNAVKICDLKPMYGVIFSKYTAGYDFWGFSDIDVIFGDIRHFVTEEDLQSNDIFTSKSRGIAGHFCILKNNEMIRHLYSVTDEYKSVLATKRLVCYDERGFTQLLLTEGQSRGVRVLFKSLVAPYGNYLWENGKLWSQVNNQVDNKERGGGFGDGHRVEWMYAHYYGKRKKYLLTSLQEVQLKRLIVEEYKKNNRSMTILGPTDRLNK